MFKKIEEQLLSNQQISKHISQILTTATNNPSLIYQQLQKIDLSNQNIKKSFQQNWIQIVQLIICCLPIEKCYQFMNDQIQNQNSLKLLKQIIQQKQIPDKIVSLVRLIQRYSSTQKQLLLMKLISKSIKFSSYIDLPYILPSFIRLEAFTLQKYLKIKNQPNTDKSDFAEVDLPIVQNCQNWCSASLINFLKQLPNFDNESYDTKRALLACFGDIYTAIHQSMRQNNLDINKLELILKSLDQYILHNFIIRQIYQIFSQQQKAQQYAHNDSNFQIKEIYLPDSKISPVGYACMVLLFSSNINSINLELQYLIPALSEILVSPYKIKIILLEKIKNLLQNPQIIKTAFEWNYPLQLFLFNLYHYLKQQYDSINKQIIFENNDILINSLVILKKIKFNSLIIQKDLYILNNIINNKLISNKNLIILLRNIQLGQGNIKCDSILLDIIQQYKSLYPTIVKDMIEDKMNQIKNVEIVNKLKLLME